MYVDYEVGWELEINVSISVVWGTFRKLEFLSDCSRDLTEPPSLELTLGVDCLLSLPQAQVARCCGRWVWNMMQIRGFRISWAGTHHCSSGP